MGHDLLRLAPEKGKENHLLRSKSRSSRRSACPRIGRRSPPSRTGRPPPLPAVIAVAVVSARPLPSPRPPLPPPPSHPCPGGTDEPGAAPQSTWPRRSAGRLLGRKDAARAAADALEEFEEDAVLLALLRRVLTRVVHGHETAAQPEPELCGISGGGRDSNFMFTFGFYNFLELHHLRILEDTQGDEKRSGSCLISAPKKPDNRQHATLAPFPPLAFANVVPSIYVTPPSFMYLSHMRELGSGSINISCSV